MMSVCIPIAHELAAQERYRLDDNIVRLVGEPNPNLVRKFTFDPQKDWWQFNREGIKAASQNVSGEAGGAQAALAAMKSQLGGGGAKSDSLYSVDLPTDGMKGVKYYDNNTDLSFSMVPQFDVHDGQVRDGRLIYPFQDGGKLIYTAKNNGMKEDIVLPRNIGDELRFSYKLELPPELEARLMDDGSVGVFSGDPTLYGNINFATDQDRAKVENARKEARKDNLLFAIPPPVIKQSGSGTHDAQAFFRLDGDTLYVFAKGLNTLTYPISIDPSVVVTSSNDFATGNNEGNIDYSTSGQIGRGQLTGGSIGGWTSTAAFTTARDSAATIAYNGYMYVIGGTNGTALSDVQYAPINANGTAGSWAATTSLPTARYNHAAVVYNGYIYVTGGTSNGTTGLTEVLYARVNSDGTIGPWTTTTSFTTGRFDHAVVTSNGYMYIIGGTNGTAMSDVQYAPINANGTVGSWTTTTSFTTARYAHTAVANNGWLYVLGGSTNSTSYLSDVQYARMNTDGTVGTWTTLNSFSGARRNHTTIAYNGYMYVIGGTNGTALSDVQYVPVYTSGVIGGWQQTSALGTSTTGHSSAVYGGYLYVVGNNNGTYSNAVAYAKVDPPGVTSSYTTVNALGTARKGVAIIAYNGYLYAVGGMTSATAATTAVNYAAINNNGTLGTWGTTTAFTTARGYHYATVYNGYMYVLGGKTGSTTTTNTVYYSKINANGTVGTWTSTTAFTNARQWLAGAVYGNYIYIAGGISNDTGTQYNDIRYASFNANGSISTWTAAATTLPQTRDGLQLVAHGGYMYLVGGWNKAGNTYYNDVQYALLNTNGSLGSWTTTSSFTTARRDHSVIVYNGYIYLQGGTNGTALSDVQYAPLKSDGTVGTWSTNTSMTETKFSFGAAIYNGNLYLGGGVNGSGTFLTTVQYATINNGGVGTAGTWTDDTDLMPTARYRAGVTAYNGYLYVVGGRDDSGNIYNNVLYSKLNDDGSIGAWSTDTHTFATPRQDLQTVVYNGYIYVIGGWNASSSTFYNDVQYAPIGSSGALTANFASTTNFSPTGRYGFGAAAYKGYMYVIGGWDNVNDLSDSRYAPINANGTVGTWSSGTSFTNGRSMLASFVYNGYIYMGGGWGSAFYNDVQYAPINADGSLGAWKATSSLNGVRQGFTMNASDGYVYALGGQPGSSSYTGEDTVQFASINANGTLGKWQHTTPMLSGYSLHGGAIYNGFIYRVGGEQGNGSGFDADNTSYAPLGSIARTGRYSRVIDLGSGASHNVTSIVYNGTLNGGAQSISFKLANTDGVFGVSRQTTSLNGSASNCALTDGGRYVWLSVVLDDAQNVAYPDNTGQSSLSDVTVNYNSFHPTPDVRMRNGKFFAGGGLRPYDTCKNM
jgi:hypothetical protein